MFIKEFIDYLSYQKRFSIHSITAYQKDLDTFWIYAGNDGYQSIEEINHLIIRSWLVSMMESGMDARSVNRKISTLKSYYKFLIREGKVEINPMSKIISPKTTKKLPVFVDKTHMENLFNFEVFEPGFEGYRNRMIMLLFYQTGMRLSELTGLKKTDIDFSNCQLKVLGKRNKERIIPFTLVFKKELEDYLQIIPADYAQGSYLFAQKNGKKLYPKQVYNIVNAALSHVTTIHKKSPHVLRHTFATHMLNNGADLNAIKEILGHANLSATQVYTHNSIEKLKNVHKQAHPKA
jgi:integrase/recombinase XerC